MKGGEWVSQRTKYQTAYGINYNDLITEIDNVKNGQYVEFYYFRIQSSGYELMKIQGIYQGIDRSRREPRIKINDEDFYSIYDILKDSFQIL